MFLLKENQEVEAIDFCYDIIWITWEFYRLQT